MYKNNPCVFLVKIIIFFFGYFFSKIVFDIEKFKRYMENGDVVFVFYRYSFFDYIILYYHLTKNGFNPPLMLYHPFPRLYGVYRKIFGKEEDVAGLIRESVKNKTSIITFLNYYKNDNFIFDLLLTLEHEPQIKMEMIPTQLLWHKRPEKTKKNLFDIVIGSAEYPGLLRKLLLFFRNYKKAFIYLGEPIFLEEFIKENSNLPAEVKVRKLRLVLGFNLTRELSAILGPRKWPRSLLIKRILND